MAMASASQNSRIGKLSYAESLTWDFSSVFKDLSQQCSIHAEVSISPDFEATRQSSGLGGVRVECRLACVCNVGVMWMSDPVSSGGHWFKSSSSLL